MVQDLDANRKNGLSHRSDARQLADCNLCLNLMRCGKINKVTRMTPHRSLLFVPVINERALEKSKGLPCDGVILDLEDSIPNERKDEARKTVVDVLQAGGFFASFTIARVNAVGTSVFESDVKALAKIGPQAILVPKVEDAKDIAAVARILDAEPAAKSTRIWFMIESALGVLNIREICAASPRLEGMIIGPNDLLKDLKAKTTPALEALQTSYGLCLIAARAHGLICIDGIYNQFKDVDGFKASCERGRLLGYEGKTLVHPNQIEGANAAFGPSDEDIDLAKRQVAAFDAVLADGQAVAVVDGQMVEKMHVAEAKEVLKLATYIEQRKGA